MKVLHLTLHRKWFEQILSRIKREEYRQFKQYWFDRLVDREYDVIVFRNGYSKDAPEMTVEFKGVELKTITWDSGVTEEVFAIQLGEILDTKNCDKFLNTIMT